MRNTNKLVYGIGTKGVEYPTRIDGKTVKEYKVWGGMLERCIEKWWRKYPTYTGTTCSENFKHYSFFYEWCNEQIGFGNTDENGKSWHLDKDLLVKGNKIYSEDTCVFLPLRLNLLLTRCNAARGSSPIGVHRTPCLGKFRATCREANKQRHLGRFSTQQEAFQAYKTFKEAYIKQEAEKYKYQLDPRAYEALLNYTVEITD